MEAARREAAEAAEKLAGLQGLAQAAAADLDRARRRRGPIGHPQRRGGLPGVRAGARATPSSRCRPTARAELGRAQERQADLTGQSQAGPPPWPTPRSGAGPTWSPPRTPARRARAEWEQVDRRRHEALGALAEAWAAVLTAAPERRGGAGAPPRAEALAAEVTGLRDRVGQQRAGRTEVDRLRVRLERRPALEPRSPPPGSRPRWPTAGSRPSWTRSVPSGFDKDALERAAAAHGTRRSTARRGRPSEPRRAAIEAAGERAKQRGRRHPAGRRRGASTPSWPSSNPRPGTCRGSPTSWPSSATRWWPPSDLGWPLQAAELFAELTDHEYDELRVDPETYQLQISDGGSVYGLDRFSGSEIDLANLALRVAISEHIHFQSGGSIGLLVLDEVFGPLDEDRKARMLLALERLRGRFRQVLVVTHDPSIKEQLPNAIEVVKLPGRRATARPIG